MQTVGIRELKTHLSRYLGAVKKGETILVTDHNVVVAEIKRPARQKVKSKAEMFIEEQIRMGRMIPAKTKKSDIEKIIRDYSGHQLLSGYDWKKAFEESREDRV